MHNLKENEKCTSCPKLADIAISNKKEGYTPYCKECARKRFIKE